MDIIVDTMLSREQAVQRLRAAISRGKRRSLLQRFAPHPHLEGDVSGDEVVLYRRRGNSKWYGRFRGHFQETGATVRLVGKFVRSSGLFMSIWAGFVVLWGLVLAVGVVVRWRGSESIAWLVAAALAATIGGGAFWFRAKNARVEADLLKDEIENAFGKHGA